MSFGPPARAAVVILGLTMGACQSSQSAGPPPAMPPTPVTLAVARVVPVEDATEYVATLKSLRSTTVQPQVDGQITQIHVVSGQRVSQGAPLAQIDARRQQAAVSSQEAELAAREAAVTFARQQAQRANELLAAGAISKQEQEQAATALETAEANLKALQAQVQQQRVQLRFFTVAAPTAGVVGDIPVRVGSVVTTQTVLTTIDQNDMLEVYVEVPVERGPSLRNGLPIQIVSSDASQPLATSSVAVTATVRISGQFFAFVAEDAGGKMVAKQRAIKVGPIVGETYPVLEGIKAGERVVTSGAQKLADGMPIQPTAGENQNAEPRTPNAEPRGR